MQPPRAQAPQEITTYLLRRNPTIKKNRIFAIRKIEFFYNAYALISTMSEARSNTGHFNYVVQLSAFFWTVSFELSVFWTAIVMNISRFGFAWYHRTIKWLGKLNQCSIILMVCGEKMYFKIFITTLKFSYYWKMKKSNKAGTYFNEIKNIRQWILKCFILKLALQFSVLSHHLRQEPILKSQFKSWMLHLPANAPSKAMEDGQVPGPLKPIWETRIVPWLLLLALPNPMYCGFWGVNQCRYSLSLSCSFSPSLPPYLCMYMCVCVSLSLIFRLLSKCSFEIKYFIL